MPPFIFIFCLKSFIFKPQYNNTLGKSLKVGYFKISPYNMLSETSRYKAVLKGHGRTLTQITQIQVYTNENHT